MPFLGYALFTGQYGEFTVPVFSVPNFTIGSEVLRAYVINMGTDTFNSVVWNTANAIYRLVVDPERTTPSKSPTYTKAFEANSVPVVGITCTDSTATISGSVWPDDYNPVMRFWVNEIQETWDPAFKPSGDPSTGNEYVDPVPCIFQLSDGKYYPRISSQTVPIRDNVAQEFVFGSKYNTTYHPLDSIVVQQTPVVIGHSPEPEPVPEPDNITIDPGPAYMALNSELQFTAKYIYESGDEIQVTPLNGKWSLVDDEGEPIAGDVSITDNGLVTLGDFSNSRFYVKVTWEGSSYNVAKAAPVYITDSPSKGDIYIPGIGGGTGTGIPSFPSGVGGLPSMPSGGGGNFGIDPSTGQPIQSDNIVNSLPGVGTASGSYEGSVSNAGLFVHYAMNSNTLKIVGDWLWADDLGLIIAKEFLSILYGSPIESAISLMSYPFNVTSLPGVTSQMQQMYWGSHAIGETFGGVKALAVTNPYATIDWGTVQLTEFWGNFLDYAPHTKLELYLPWCTGFVPIDPNECLPGSLRVVTNIELAKGTCLHNVIGNDGRVIAAHSGTCGKQLPLTALDTSGKALQLVSMAASAIVAGGSGAAADVAGSRAADAYRRENLGDVFSGDKSLSSYRAGMASASRRAGAAHSYAGRRAESRALAGAAAAYRTPASVQRNGSFTGSSAGLGVQYPYLIISRPTQSVPKQYGHHYGYPSNIYAPLLTLRGYTEIGEIHLTGFTCTDDELSEIDSLLKSGVIL